MANEYLDLIEGPAAPPVNEYADLIPTTEEIALPRTSAGQMAKPEPAGQAVKLGDSMGFPASIIGADLETYQQVNKGQTAAAAVKGNPFVASYVARNEMAAEVSNDDYINLNRLSTKLSQLDMPGKFKQAWEVFSKQHPIATEAARGFGQAFGARPIGFTEQQKKDFPMMYETWQLELSLLDIGLRSMTGAIGAVGGLAGGTMKELGVNEAWSRRFGRDVRMMTEMALQSPLFPDIVATPTIGTKKGVTDVSYNDFMATLRGMKTRAEIDEFLARRDGGPMDLHKETLQIEHVKSDSAALDSAVQAAAETNTKTRAPQLLQDFVAGHETGTIQLPATAIRDLYAAEGKVPAKGDGLLGFIPGLADNIGPSMISGVDVKIPVADYLANIEPTVHEKLKENIRFSDDGVTLAEVAEAKEIKEAQVEKETVTAAALRYQDGRVETGKSHLEIVDRPGFVAEGAEEGFVTSTGRFVGRVEANKIAEQASQVTEAPKRFMGPNRLVAEDLAAAPATAPKPIEVWHGSPYEFEAIDMSKVGTGEGAQSYGHGSYWAEARAVGENYFSSIGIKRAPDNLSQFDREAYMLAFDSIQQSGHNSVAAKESLVKGMESSPTSKLLYQRAIELFDTVTASLYRAVINAPREAFIDFDKPLRDQPDEILDKLVAAVNKVNADAFARWTGDPSLLSRVPEVTKEQLKSATLTAGDWMDAMGGGSHGAIWSESSAMSAAFREAGIPGIRYLDQGSRIIEPPAEPLAKLLDLKNEKEKMRLLVERGEATPEQMSRLSEIDKEQDAIHQQIEEHKKAQETRNYVIFDPSIITILERNGQLLRQETAKNELNLGLRPLFSSPLPTMDKPLFDRYNNLIKKQQEALIEKTREWALGKNRNKEFEAALEKGEVIARAEVDAMPDIAADRFFRNGKLEGFDGTVPAAERKMDTAVVDQMIPDNSIPAIMKTEGGVHPDALAEVLGYGSGREMLEALNNLHEIRKGTGENPKQYVDRLVEERALELASEAVGEVAKIEEAARALALSDVHLDILTAEVKALALESGVEPALNKDQLKAMVRNNFDTLPVSAARNYKQFQAAASRAGRKTEMQLMKGDTVAAFQAKQQHVIAFMLAKESEAFNKEMVKAERLFDRFTQKTVTNVDQVFTNQIQVILERIGYPTKRNKADLIDSLGGENLQSFAQKTAAAGWELSIPDFLMNELWQKPIKDMTVEEFGLINEAVQTLAHVGRESRLIQAEGKKIEFQLLKDEIIGNLQTLPERNLTDPKKAEKMRYKLDAEITRMEALADDFDLRDPLGPFNTAVFRPVTNAKHKENQLLTELKGKVEKLGGDRAWRNALNEDVAHTALIDPLTGEAFKLNRGDVLNIALNLGNRSNISKLTRGYEADEMNIRRLVDRVLTEQDWKFVQGLWDIFDDLWKTEIVPMYRELSGVAPNRVEPVPIQTRFGEFKGGYFPLIYDKYRSSIDVIKDTNPLSANFFRATTPNGYSKSRKESFAEPIQIQSTIEATAGRLQQMVHDIAFRRAIIDASKIIYDKDIRAAVRLNYGPEYEAQLSPWLEAVANKFNMDDVAVSGMNSILRKARMNLVIQALGFNLKVILSPDVGPIATAGNIKTAANMFRSPSNVQAEFTLAHSKSAELQNTMRNLDRDLDEKFHGLTKRYGWDAFQQETARAAMLPASGFSHLFRTITWLTEYRQALRDGVAEADAVFTADKAVRRYHGASSVVDLPAMFRSSESMKMLTIFQTYFNTMYNWQREIPGDFRRGDYSSAFSAIVGAFLIPSLFGIVLFNERRKDEKWGETVGKGLLQQLMASTPFTNLISSPIIQGYESRMPLSSIIRGVYDVGKDVTKTMTGKEASKKAVQHSINLPGYLFGLPTGQFARSAQFIYDVNKRRQNPKTFGQWTRGLIYGNIEDKKR